MEFKPYLIFLLLALGAMMTDSSPIHDATWGLARSGSSHDGLCNGSVGECIGEENEMVLDSESNRRALAQGQGRYISYAALKANNVPCGRRGASYYNCQKRGAANPYRRGCSRATNCARQTD